MASEKSRRFARARWLGLVLCVPFAIGVAGHWQRGGPELLEQVLTLVSQKSVDSIPPDSVYELAARGLVRDINDPYASLYSPAELSSFMRNTIGNAYGGLGMGIEPEGSAIVVSNVFPHSPAANGGIQPGDQFVAIEGVPVKGWTVDRVSKTVTGPVGTPVTVTFARVGVAEPFTTHFTRALVHALSVPFTLMLDGKTGYIPLQRFNETSSSEVAAAIDALRTAGATRYIVDLRGNGGGDFDQALAISNLFLPRGDLLATLRQRGKGAEAHNAQANPLLTQEPVAVLVDGFTASASEIVAGALQDHDRALVLGTTSFGKGLVQSVYNLDHGYALKLTTGKWYTPSGRSIQRERKFLNGRFVEDDSAGDSAVAHQPQPTTRSDAGRTLVAGGGITPDVVVRPDTTPTAVRAFLRAVSPKASDLNAALFDIARNERTGGRVRQDFTVSPALRDDLFQRLVKAGAPLDRAAFDAAQPFVDRLLTQRILSLAIADSAATRRTIATDATMQRALALLGRSQTQAQLLAAARAEEEK